MQKSPEVQTHHRAEWPFGWLSALHHHILGQLEQETVCNLFRVQHSGDGWHSLVIYGD